MTWSAVPAVSGTSRVSFDVAVELLAVGQELFDA
jgi:hypothetical protein